MRNTQPSKMPHHWMQIVFSIVMISSLLIGCRLPWQPTPETTNDKETLPETEGAQITTTEPLKDLPPALVEVSPIPNSYISLQEPITLNFNQPMDTSSVEAAIHFEPRISGRFIWENDQSVTFTPDQSLPSGSALNIVIDTSAQAVNKNNLQDAVELHFQTSEHLQVTQVMPPDNAQDVNPESAIFVAFNQPVVPLGMENGSAPAFTLSPEVPGNGEWLNTSTYIFTPEPSMNGGTEYTLQLNEELMGTSGSKLDPAQEPQFTFTTTHPAVLNISPANNQRLGLDGPITIQFNIRMDRESVEAHFNLLDPNSNRIDGNFEWDQDHKSFTFIPSTALRRNTMYTIQLNQGAESLGGLPIDTQTEVLRTTYPVFSASASEPAVFQSYYGEFGQYQINFTAPIAPDDFWKQITIQPDVTNLNAFLGSENKSIILNGYYRPEQIFTLTLDARLEDIWGGQLGEDLTFTFSTPPAPPSLSLVTGLDIHDLVFVPADVSELATQATNINTVTIEIAPIRMDDLITLLHPDNYGYRQTFLPDSLESQTKNLNLKRNVSEVVKIPLSYKGSPLAPGVYFLGVTSPDLVESQTQNYQKLFLIVSENNLVMKIAPEQAFIWATRLLDQSPLNDAPVKVFNNEGDLVASGRTDNDGLFLSDFDRFDEPYTDFFTVVGEPDQSNFSFAISTWGQGFSLYEMGISLDTLPALKDAYIYTDRPIYRPGDHVYFRGVVFSRENGIPTQSEIDNLTVTIYSDYGMSGVPASLYSEDMVLSQFGTFDGSVTLPIDSAPGMYRIEVSENDSIIKDLYFDVATYRKPEIEVTFQFNQAEILRGEDLIIEGQAQYYFGLPASDLIYNWILYKDDAYIDLPGYQVGPLNTSWLTPRIQDAANLDLIIADGQGITDEQGQINLKLTSEDLVWGDLLDGQPQEFHLEITVTEDSGFPVSNRDSVIVHPESVYIGVKPEAFFGRAGMPFSFSILTVNWDKLAVGSTPVEAVFESIEWKFEKTTDPEIPYRYVAETSLIDSASPITGADGLARVSFTPPEPGTYQISLKSGAAVTQAIVWVSGSGSAVWPQQTQNQIQLTANSETYQPGQTADIFFPNPLSGPAKALVTIERGRVMDTQIINVDGAGASLSIPLTDAFAPNIYVSVVLLGVNENGDPDFRQGVNNLLVEPIRKTLNADLIVDPTTSAPGEDVSATLIITDLQGNPVQGEFSIAVVDKAVLALVEPNSLPILEALYGERPLSVQTSYSLKTYAAQLALASMDLGRGGGGDSIIQLDIRENFPDTAYWQANIITGADGTASVSFPLPDSLTTWVVEIRGLTDAFEVGQASAEIVTQKDLMVRPVTPRFLVDGDMVEMAAIVHNNTTDLLEVDVSLKAVGFSLEDSTQQTQNVTIASGANTRVTWRGTVESVDSVDLVFQAASGSLSDASAPVWGDLHVLKYAMPYTFSTAGQLTQEGQRLELVSLPISTETSSGELTLELNPSLTSILVEGLQSLENTPYDDTVSIASRLLANLNAYLVLSNLSVDNPQLVTNLTDQVEKGIHKLVEAQNIDGGWSWWVGENLSTRTSDPFITAYVLIGLEQASEIGFEVGEHFINRAVDTLSSRLMPPENGDQTWMLDQLAFQVYALRRSNVDLLPFTEGLYARRSELSPWSLALLGLTLRETEGLNDRVNIILVDLESIAIRSATGVHWESSRASWLLPGTPIFNTAVSVYMLAELDPASTSLTLALQYLIKLRDSNNHWTSTFESAWVLMAIAEAVQGTGDYQADFDFQASLNNIIIAEGAASGTTPLTAVTATAGINSLHPNDPNALLIERGAGAGNLYYRADLQTYQSAADSAAVNRGITLHRQYYKAGQGCPGSDGCTPITSLTLDPDEPAQLITAALTIIVPHDMYHLIVKDWIPAGTEVLNRNLLTSQTLPEDPGFDFDPRAPFRNGWGWWLFNQPQMFDDHVLWTADYLPAGTYTLTYELLPYQRGTYQVLPSHAWQYFYPEVMGTSTGDLFTIN